MAMKTEYDRTLLDYLILRIVYKASSRAVKKEYNAILPDYLICGQFIRHLLRLR